MDGSDEAEKAWSRAQSITSKANGWRFLGMFPFYTSPPKASWELPGVEDLLVICHLWRGAHHSHGGPGPKKIGTKEVCHLSQQCPLALRPRNMEAAGRNLFVTPFGTYLNKGSSSCSA